MRPSTLSRVVGQNISVEVSDPVPLLTNDEEIVVKWFLITVRSFLAAGNVMADVRP